MPTFWERMTGAYRGFREPALYSDPSGGTAGGWSDFDTRRERYLILWAFYEQNAFRDAQGWPAAFRASRGLYNGTRDLFGVSHRLGEFWPAHLQGGGLDPLAGDGVAQPSALPILMDAEDPLVREALAELWKRSNWQIAKDVGARFGATLGDLFYEVCDDAEAETVRLNVLHPEKVRWCDLTREDNVEAYELEYMRPDPRNPRPENMAGAAQKMVRYNEVVRPDPRGGFRWTTYLDGQWYQWPGNEGSMWTVPDLPFAPLVKVQHKNVGTGWGHAEPWAAVTGVVETADLASCLTDWARRACNAPHMLSGVANPATDAKEQARLARLGQTPAQNRSAMNAESNTRSQSYAENSARTGDPYLYAPADARASSLVHPLPVGDIGAQIDRLRAKTLEDYPELLYERQRLSGDVSGETLREARKPAEAKVLARRVEYDGGSERAFRMALTLGGLRGYRHYESVGVGDYDAGRLDFRIGARPAFAPDPAEETADRLAKYAAMKAAADAGLPFVMALREAGYNEADVKKMVAEKAKQDAAAMEQIRQQQALAMSDTQPQGAFGQ